MAPDVAAMLADWLQTIWFTVQGVRSTLWEFNLGIPLQKSCSPSPFFRFHRKLAGRLKNKGLLPVILLQRGQFDASADQSEEIHIEHPACMDDFFLVVISDTAADLLPRVSLATQATMETAKEHGLQLNLAATKTEAVFDFRGKGRQQVSDLSRSWMVSGRQQSRSRRASRSGW